MKFASAITGWPPIALRMLHTSVMCSISSTTTSVISLRAYSTESDVPLRVSSAVRYGGIVECSRRIAFCSAVRRSSSARQRLGFNAQHRLLPSCRLTPGVGRVMNCRCAAQMRCAAGSQRLQERQARREEVLAGAHGHEVGHPERRARWVGRRPVIAGRGGCALLPSVARVRRRSSRSRRCRRLPVGSPTAAAAPGSYMTSSPAPVSVASHADRRLPPDVALIGQEEREERFAGIANRSRLPPPGLLVLRFG